MAITKQATIQVRQSSTPTSDTVLKSGEFGYDTTNNILKLGDGVTCWSDLPAIDTNRSDIRVYYDAEGYPCYENR